MNIYSVQILFMIGKFFHMPDMFMTDKKAGHNKYSMINTQAEIYSP